MLERWAAVLSQKACWTMTGAEEIVLEPGTLWVEIFCEASYLFGKLIPQSSHILHLLSWRSDSLYLNYLTFYKSVGWWFSISVTILDSKNVINYVPLKTLSNVGISMDSRCTIKCKVSHHTAVMKSTVEVAGCKQTFHGVMSLVSSGDV